VADRLFRDGAPLGVPDPPLLGDFLVAAAAKPGALAQLYGLPVAPDVTERSLAEHFTRELGRAPRRGDALRLGEVLLIAHKVVAGRVTQGGLQLAEPEGPAKPGKPGGPLPAGRRPGPKVWGAALSRRG